MGAKQYLRQVKRLDNIVNAKLEQLQMVKTMSTKVTTDLSIEKVQTSISSDKLGSIIVKIISLENEINYTIDKLIDLKSEIMQKIDSLENEDFKLLLILRYLNFRKWEQIASDMGFTVQWIHELHKRALIELEKKINNTLL